MAVKSPALEPVRSPGAGRRGRAGRFWKSVSASPSNLIGFALTLLFVVVTVLAPLVAPYDPLFMSRGEELSPPSARHLLGTDEFGRDLLSRVIYGARVSLAVGFGGVLTAALFGVLLGLLSGYAGPGSVLDTVVMRAMDTLLAFPAILIGIIIIVILGASALNVAVAVAFAHTPLITRLVRAEVLRERERDYVQAARALGAAQGRILFRHLLPNTAGVIVVQIATSLAVAILLEAALSFLGLGTRPPAPSWGAMLRDAQTYLRQAPWYALAPGVALTLLIVGINFFADALRVFFGRR